MPWPHLLAAFFAGGFLANAVPHFVHGISGNRFPTPFAKPPGKGLSSPTVNVVWGLLNLAAGYALARVGHITLDPALPLALSFLGAAVLSTAMSIRFASKHTA